MMNRDLHFSSVFSAWELKALLKLEVIMLCNPPPEVGQGQLGAVPTSHGSKGNV